ncbi:MAG: transglycosylase SLT domain-containing protein [Candidatus Symbiothrix sp.]|jgi:membrane-bound lytic murein transglycosylase D|nr:transglycosylase SLT domain-containing protein [Candidatus Symbiothrix sp.]
MKTKGYLLLFFLLTSLTGAFAQNEVSIDAEAYLDNDDNALFIPESWEIALDSLKNAWHIQYYIDKNTHPGYEEAVLADASVYKDRLSRMNTIMDMPYNEEVRKYIDFYLRRKSTFEYILGMENFYFPMIEQVLDLYGLPLELKNLTIVESALNPTIVSRMGATGLWQFMLGTGKQYGLEINSLVDERRDPLKATYAACAYLKNLYQMFGDWNLALAAYNCGEGNVNKAIRRAGKQTDFWSLYPYLPRETRNYVPQFIAANYVMNYYANHNFRPAQIDLPISTDTVMVNQAIHFDQIASVLNVDKELIRALNPQYKRDIIPGNTKARYIKLPTLSIFAFVEKEDSIANYRRNDFFAPQNYVSDNQPEKIKHKVRKGETVRLLESKYGVSASNIKRWNNLKSNTLVAGRILTIYVDNGGYIANIATPSAPEIKTAKASSSSTPEFIHYKVKKGDSLSTIAKKYSGCSYQDLIKINHMKNSQIKVGQYIKIPKA